MNYDKLQNVDKESIELLFKKWNMKPNNFTYEDLKTLINEIPNYNKKIYVKYDIYGSIIITTNIINNSKNNQSYNLNHNIVIRCNNWDVLFFQNFGVLCVYDKCSAMTIRNIGVCVIKDYIYVDKLFTSGIIKIYKKLHSTVPLNLDGNINIYCDLNINKKLIKESGCYFCENDSSLRNNYYVIEGDYDIYNEKDLLNAIKISNIKLGI